MERVMDTRTWFQGGRWTGVWVLGNLVGKSSLCEVQPGMADWCDKARRIPTSIELYIGLLSFIFIVDR